MNALSITIARGSTADKLERNLQRIAGLVLIAAVVRIIPLFL